MNKNIIITNQNSKAVLAKSKNLLDLTKKLVTKISNYEYKPFVTHNIHDVLLENIQYSKDCKYIIANSSYKILIWDISSGKYITTVYDYSSEIISIAITLDSENIIYTNKNGRVNIFNLNTFKVYKTFKLKNIEDKILYGTKITLNDKYLIIAYSENLIDIYDITNFTFIKSITLDLDYIYNISIINESGFIIFEISKNLQIIDIHNTEYREILEKYQYKIVDNYIVIWTLCPMSLKIWDIYEKKYIKNHIITDKYNNFRILMAITHDLEYAIFLTDEYQIAIYNLQNDTIKDLHLGFLSFDTGIVKVNNSNEIFQTSRDKIYKYNIFENNEYLNKTIFSHKTDICYLETIKHNRLLSYGDDGQFLIWDTKKEECLNKNILSIKISDSKKIIAYIGKSTFKLLDISKGLWSKTINIENINFLHFSSDEKHIILSLNFKILILETSTLNVIYSVIYENDDFEVKYFSDNLKYLIIENKYYKKDEFTYFGCEISVYNLKTNKISKIKNLIDDFYEIYFRADDDCSIAISNNEEFLSLYYRDKIEIINYELKKIFEISKIKCEKMFFTDNNINILNEYEILKYDILENKVYSKKINLNSNSKTYFELDYLIHKIYDSYDLTYTFKIYDLSGYLLGTIFIDSNQYHTVVKLLCADKQTKYICIRIDHEIFIYNDNGEIENVLFHYRDIDRISMLKFYSFQQIIIVYEDGTIEFYDLILNLITHTIYNTSEENCITISSEGFFYPKDKVIIDKYLRVNENNLVRRLTDDEINHFYDINLIRIIPAMNIDNDEI